MKPFQVVKDFERALAEYTGAPYVVTVNSCTMALLLAVAWHMRNPGSLAAYRSLAASRGFLPPVEIPKRTYVGVPMSIIHAGGRPTFRDEDWRGSYQLNPLPVWDSARLFTSGMYPNWTPGRDAKSGGMVCVSFHWSKTLGIQQGGAILLDNAEADYWLRRARFDGRQEGIPPRLQTPESWIVGWHCYMSPEIAAEGLVRLSHLPKHNAPLPNDDYSDLSTMELFRG